MEALLNISGVFRDEAELGATIRQRKICYDTEPYYLPNKQGSLLQIGIQINLYGTFPDPDDEASPDDREFSGVLRDVRRVAKALSNTCDPLHMCDSAIAESNSVSYAHERNMRPDVTVHIPVFDQDRFGHPIDDRVRETAAMAGKILEQAGVRKTRWHD